MKPTTRLFIVDTLRKHQAASALDLSRALGMTAANVRHHLAVLELNDLVEVISQRREGGRGRPVNIYGLAGRVLGDGLDELAAAVFDVWMKGTPEKDREAGLRSMAQRLAGAALTDGTVPIARRLTLTVNRLNEMHYQARWEAGAAGPRLILGHCPYAEIVARIPELCRMDSYLLEQMLSCPVMQLAKLEPNQAGLRQCSFVIR